MCKDVSCRCHPLLPGFWNAWTAAEALEYTHGLVTNEEGWELSQDVCGAGSHLCNVFDFQVVLSSKEIPSIFGVFARTGTRAHVLCSFPAARLQELVQHVIEERKAQASFSGVLNSRVPTLGSPVQDNVSVVVLHIMPQAGPRSILQFYEVGRDTEIQPRSRTLPDGLAIQLEPPCVKAG